MRRYFQKWILVKSLNWAPAKRGEERMVEGDLAQHHVAPGGRFLDVPGRHAGEGGERARLARAP